MNSQDLRRTAEVFIKIRILRYNSFRIQANANSFISIVCSIVEFAGEYQPTLRAPFC